MSSTYRETDMPQTNNDDISPVVGWVDRAVKAFSGNNDAPATSAELRESLAAKKLERDEAERRWKESLPKDQYDYQTHEQKRASITNREEFEALTAEVQRIQYELSRAERLDQEATRKQEAAAVIKAAGEAQARHRQAAEAFEAQVDKIEKQIRELEIATQEASKALDDQEAAACSVYAKAVASGDPATLDSASQDIRKAQEARANLTQTARLNESQIGALRNEGNVCAEQLQAARDAERQAQLEQYQALLALLGNEFDRAVDALEAAAANVVAVNRAAGARHAIFSDLKVCRIGEGLDILTGRSIAARAAFVSVTSLIP